MAPFFSVANGLSQAFLTTIVSRSAGESVQGEILSINASVTAVAQAIAPVVAGYLAAQIVAQAPIYIASLFIVLSGVIFWLFF